MDKVEMEGLAGDTEADDGFQDSMEVQDMDQVGVMK